MWVGVLIVPRGGVLGLEMGEGKERGCNGRGCWVVVTGRVGEVYQD